MTAPAPGGADRAPATHEDLGVSVTRDLSGSGRLARGAETRFSTLRLRSAGTPAPRAERDEAPSAPVAAAKQASAASPAVPADLRPDDSAEADEAAGDPPAARASPVARVLRWLGLGRGPGRRM